MTFDLGAVSDLQPLLKTCHNLHIMWAHGVTVIFHDLMFGDDEDGVVANDGE